MTVENEDAKRPSAARLRDWRGRDREGARPAAAVLAEEPRHDGRRGVPGLAMPTWVWKKGCWRLRRGSARMMPFGWLPRRNSARLLTPSPSESASASATRRIQPEQRLPRVRHAVVVEIAIEDVEIGETVEVVTNHGRRMEEDVAAVLAQVAGEGELGRGNRGNRIVEAGDGIAHADGHGDRRALDEPVVGRAAAVPAREGLAGIVLHDPAQRPVVNPALRS